jgi:hypothetical protein
MKLNNIADYVVQQHVQCSHTVGVGKHPVAAQAHTHDAKPDLAITLGAAMVRPPWLRQTPAAVADFQLTITCATKHASNPRLAVLLPAAK